MDSASNTNTTPVVNLRIIDRGVDRTLYNIEESTIIRHSKTVRDQLLGKEVVRNNLGQKKVWLYGASSAALIFVLERIRKYGDDLDLRMGDRKLDICIAIFQAATKVLQVEPEQSKIEGHIVGYVAHTKLTGAELEWIQTAFGEAGMESRVWKTMIHQTAYYAVGGEYTKKELAELNSVAAKYPVLANHLEANFQELKKRKEDAANHHAIQQAKKGKSTVPAQNQRHPSAGGSSRGQRHRNRDNADHTYEDDNAQDAAPPAPEDEAEPKPDFWMRPNRKGKGKKRDTPRQDDEGDGAA